MIEAAQWRSMIEAASASRPAPIGAGTVLKSFPTFSKPIVMACADGREYVVKGRQVGRAIFNDQVIGLLGRALAAPVGEVHLVDVPQALITPDIQHLVPGVSHGCVWIPGCTERQGIMHVDVADNRPRFARLAILYGWAFANDHQFLYKNTQPHLVYSVDHGHFFPGGPNWTTATLAGTAAATADAQITTACRLTDFELREAFRQLVNIDASTIARGVAVPPDEWGVPMDERIALATYLAARRNQLLAAFASQA